MGPSATASITTSRSSSPSGEYIGIVTATRGDLGYEKLEPDDQGFVDRTYVVREQCVAAHVAGK